MHAIASCFASMPAARIPSRPAAPRRGWRMTLGALAIGAVTLVSALAGGQSARAEEPVYIRSGQVDLAKVLAPAPLPDSRTTQDDFRILFELQASRTPAQVEQAKTDVLRVLSGFSGAVGTDLSKTAAPVANEVIDRAWKQAYVLVIEAKKHWARERPYLVNAKIQLVLPAENTPSYPSGHATYGTLMAILLANMVPEKATAIFERGWEMGFDRLIGGVHYPSDVDAGRISASVLGAELLRSPVFQADLARAAVEVRTALKLPPLASAATPVAAPAAAPSATPATSPAASSAPVQPLPAAAAPAR